MKLLSTFIAVFAMIAAAAGAETTYEEYSLEMLIEENGEVIAEPQIVVKAGKEYMVEVPSGKNAYKLVVEVAADTATAAKAAIERDLGDAASSFVFVNAAISMNVETTAQGLARRDVIDTGLLVFTRRERAMRAAGDFLNESFTASSGKPLQSLAVSVVAKPWTGN